MIYELCEYKGTPGAAEKLHQRCAEHTLGIFARLDLVGFPDKASRAETWKAFAAVPERQRVRAESEIDGPLIATRTTRVLATADCADGMAARA